MVRLITLALAPLRCIGRCVLACLGWLLGFVFALATRDWSLLRGQPAVRLAFLVAAIVAGGVHAQGACCGGSALVQVATPAHVPPLPRLVGQEQAPARTPLSSRCSWWSHRDDPQILLLYLDNQLLGVLDPEASSWRWTLDGKRHDLIAVLTGQPRDTGHKGAGALPPAKDKFRNSGIPESERKGTSADEWNRRLKEAGLPPLPRSAGDKSACQCDDCECKDGRVSPNCKCGSGTCRCADVARPAAGIEEKDGGGPDGRQFAGGTAPPVIDGSPRNQDFRLGGVDTSKLGTTPRYQINDKSGSREVGAAEALSAISAGNVPDDSTHVRLTVIGADALRRQVVSDMNNSPELAWLKGKAVINDYAPTHWRIRDGGFVTPAAGGVVIYAQSPDGKVLWRQDSYEGGIESLARALRDKVPGYDPNKDPSPKKPGPVPIPAPDRSPTLGGLNLWWLAVPAAVFLAFYAAARRKAAVPT